MNSIPGMEQLNNMLSQEQISQLTKAADRHKTESNITFTILSADSEMLEIETIQGETKSRKYAKEATLITRTKDLFNKFFPDTQLSVNPVPFAPSPASVVSPSWLEDKMKEKGLRIKKIAFDTGIDRESIADWINGKRSMSQIVKAMFYFYLSK